MEEYRINCFPFNDELTFFSKQQAEEFVDKLLEGGLEFYWNADIRANLSTSDLKLFEKTKQSGCVGFGYSLESADTHILESMNKHIELRTLFGRQRSWRKRGSPVEQAQSWDIRRRLLRPSRGHLTSAMSCAQT
jgi:hypothetical protein